MTEQVRRSARLVEIENLLRQNPRGLKTTELAQRTGYSSRTIQRDLGVLEGELNVPLVEGEGRRWRLMPGATPIGSVRFSLQEARAMYLATRQFFRHQWEPDPDALSALQKLAGALPPEKKLHSRNLSRVHYASATHPGTRAIQWDAIAATNGGAKHVVWNRSNEEAQRRNSTRNVHGTTHSQIALLENGAGFNDAGVLAAAF